jgi:hypothetical protein
MDLQTTNMHILILGWRTFNMGIIRLIFVNAYYKHLKIVHAQLKASSVHANTYKVEDSLPKFENQQSSIKKIQHNCFLFMGFPPCQWILVFFFHDFFYEMCSFTINKAIS